MDLAEAEAQRRTKRAMANILRLGSNEDRRHCTKARDLDELVELREGDRRGICELKTSEPRQLVCVS